MRYRLEDHRSWPILRKFISVNAESVPYNSLINASRIKDAAIGIQLRPLPWFDPLVVHEDAEHPKLIMENSFIEDCEVGVQFGYGFSDSEINSFSIFRNNNVGILYANHTGLKLDRTYFFENTEGIRSVDGYMHVRDGNAFHGGEIGISVEGTLPLGGGIDIGDMGEGWNLFASDVKDAIRSNGAEHAAGANIVNCQFKNVQESATVFEGANQYLFANNSVALSTNGMVAIAAGDNINESKCNEFEDLNNIGIYYKYDNSQSQFLENFFIGQQDENVYLDNATVLDNIGTVDNPATNCFSVNGVDIFTKDNTSFKYYFYQAVQAPLCEEPLNVGNYEKIERPIKGDHCQGNVGIFGLISPGGNGTTGFDPHTVRSNNYAGHISKETLNGFIENQISQVIAAGGDDPRTYVIESSAFQAEDLGVKEKILDQWIRYAIYRGVEQNDYNYIETLLTPLKQWRWQTRLYGVKVLRGNFLGAQQFLQSLPANREEEIHFQGVQQINLRRLLSGTKGNAITQADTDYLLTVAALPYASSGYAHSLYRILTGIKLPYTLPEVAPLPKLAPKEVQVNQSLEKILIVYPNPFQHSFTLQLSNAQLNLVSLYNSNGRWLRDIPCQSNKIQLEFKEYPAGLYFLKVYDDAGKQYIQKVIKE